MTGTRRSSSAVLVAALIAMAFEARAFANSGSTNASALSTTSRRIVISLADCRLALMEGTKVLRVFRTAVGAPGSPSPVGTYTIVNRVLNPTYFAPGKVIPPGPANPLGTRWLGLSLDSYGIHGTNKPKSIGKAASHGCIRLRNDDMEELFRLVRPGDQVEIVSEFNDELTRIFSQNQTALSTAAVVRFKAERD